MRRHLDICIRQKKPATQTVYLQCGSENGAYPQKFFVEKMVINDHQILQVSPLQFQTNQLVDNPKPICRWFKLSKSWNFLVFPRKEHHSHILKMTSNHGQNHMAYSHHIPIISPFAQWFSSPPAGPCTSAASRPSLRGCTAGRSWRSSARGGTPSPVDLAINGFQWDFQWVFKGMLMRFHGVQWIFMGFQGF